MLEYDSSDLDEGSDREDPEATLREQVKGLREEARNKQDFVEAITEQRGVKRRLQEATDDLERTRMRLEDTQGLR